MPNTQLILREEFIQRAMANESLGLVGFSTAMVFLAILAVGFVYEWKKGALDWE